MIFQVEIVAMLLGSAASTAVKRLVGTVGPAAGEEVAEAAVEEILRATLRAEGDTRRRLSSIEAKLDKLATAPYRTAMTTGYRNLQFAHRASRTGAGHEQLLDKALQDFVEAEAHAQETHAPPDAVVEAQLLQAACWLAKGCIPDFHLALSDTAVKLSDRLTAWNRIVNAVRTPPGKKTGQAGVAELVKSVRERTKGWSAQQHALYGQYRARALERYHAAYLLNTVQSLRRAYGATAEQAPILRGFYDDLLCRIMTPEEAIEVRSREGGVRFWGHQRPVYEHPLNFGGLTVRILDVVVRKRLRGYFLVDAVVDVGAPSGRLGAEVGAIGGGYVWEGWEGVPTVGTTAWPDDFGWWSCPPIPSQRDLPRWNGAFREAARLPPRVAVRRVGREAGFEQFSIQWEHNLVVCRPLE